MLRRAYLLVASLIVLIGIAEAQNNHLVGPNASVETDGTVSGGSVSLLTNNAGPIQFYTNKSKCFYIDGSTCELVDVAGGGFAGTITLDNDSYLKAENALGSADLSLLKADSSDHTVLNAGTGKTIKLSINGTAEATISDDALTFSGAASTINFGATSGGFKINGTQRWTITDSVLGPIANNYVSIGATNAAVANIYARNHQADTGSNTLVSARNGSVDFYTVASDATPVIRWRVDSAGDFIGQTAGNNNFRAASSDGTDNAGIQIAGGGGTTTGRGGLIAAFGNEYGSAVSGDVDLRTGDAASAEISLRAVSTTGQVRIYTNGADRWVFSQNGDLVAQGANSEIITSTSDASDSSTLRLSGGGAANNSARGGYITLGGNENGSYPGEIRMVSGNVANSKVFFQNGSTSSFVAFAESTGNNTWLLNNSGVLSSEATYGGGIILKNTGANLTPILIGTSAIDSDISSISSTHPGILINQNANTSDSALFVANGAHALGAWMRFYKTRATAPATDANTIVNASDQIAYIPFTAADGTTYRNAAAIEAIVDGTPGASDMPGALIFYTTPDGSATPAQALKIGQDKAATFAGDITSTDTGSVGWTPVAAANQACNTTCTSGCVFGIDSAAPQTWLACTDATADMCLCAGAS